VPVSHVDKLNVKPPQPESSLVVDMLWPVFSSASQSANVNEIFYIDEFQLLLEKPLVLKSNLNFSLPERWKEKEEKSPCLSDMANDIIAFPATLVDIGSQ
jgi:hypothetical protein